MEYESLPDSDLSAATRRIRELDQRVKELERLVFRMDGFIKWQFFRGASYEYAKVEGPGHKARQPDTYYPKFDVTDK